jgi:hypothetical protein
VKIVGVYTDGFVKSVNTLSGKLQGLRTLKQVGPIFTAVLCFLGDSAKLREATISFVMSVHMEQLGSYWRDINEI